MAAVNKNERVQYVNISTSTLIKGGKGRFYGFYVNSTSSGVFVVYDNTSATGTKIHNSLTPTIGLYQYNNGVDFETGLYVSVSSGSIDLTIFYA